MIIYIMSISSLLLSVTCECGLFEGKDLFIFLVLELLTGIVSLLVNIIDWLDKYCTHNKEQGTIQKEQERHWSLSSVRQKLIILPELQNKTRKLFLNRDKIMKEDKESIREWVNRWGTEV